MTTTLYAPAPYTAFESNGYRITQAGTAVPDGLVQAIVAAVYQADGVLLTSSAGGTALVQVGSYYNPGTGTPTSDNLPAGSEIKDSVGGVFEKKADGTWVAAAANSLLTYAPLDSPALTGTPTVNGATVEDRTHAAATYGPLGLSKFATGDKSIFVSKSGNDSNDGLAPGGAKLTIGAALTALSTGGTVQLGPGNWNEAVTVSASETTIRGCGPFATNLSVTSAGTGIHVAGSSGTPLNRVNVRDLGFTGDATGVAIVYDYGVIGAIDNVYYKNCAEGVQLNNCSYVDISRLKTDGNLTRGVYFYKSVDCKFYESTISGSVSTNVLAVQVDSGCDGVALTNVNINLAATGVRISHTDVGTHYPYSTKLTGVDAGGGTANGFEFLSGGGTQLTGCSALTQTGGYGFFVNTAGGVLLTNCRAINNGKHGFNADHDNWQIMGGEFAGNGTANANTWDGIHASACSHWQVMGVRSGQLTGYSNTQNYGLSITSGCDYYRVGFNDWLTNIAGDYSDLSRGANATFVPVQPAAGMPLRTGSVYATASTTGTPATALLVDSRAYATPIKVDRVCTVDRIGFEITTPGSTGAVVRLGIYRDVGSFPGARVVDAGTIDATQVAGYYELTISQVLTPGTYWLVATPQGAPTTQVTARVHGGGVVPSLGNATGVNLTSTNYSALTQSSLSGALPTPLAPTAGSTVAPRVVVRVAS